MSFQSKHIGAFPDCVIAGEVRSVGLFRLLGFVGLLSEPSHEEVSGGFLTKFYRVLSRIDHSGMAMVATCWRNSRSCVAQLKSANR